MDISVDKDNGRFTKAVAEQNAIDVIGITEIERQDMVKKHLSSDHFSTSPQYMNIQKKLQEPVKYMQHDIPETKGTFHVDVDSTKSSSTLEPIADARPVCCQPSKENCVIF